MKNHKNYYKISVISAFLMLLSTIFEIYFLSLILFIVALFTFVYGKWAEADNKTITEYSNFTNANEELGMCMKEIKDINSKYLPIKTINTATVNSSTCQCCGSIMVNGKCLYCGNEQFNDTNSVVLMYKTKFGEKTFTFKDDILINKKSSFKPLKNFLILQ